MELLCYPGWLNDVDWNGLAFLVVVIICGTSIGVMFGGDPFKKRNKK